MVKVKGKVFPVLNKAQIHDDVSLVYLSTTP
jgi:hypothetical protein